MQEVPYLIRVVVGLTLRAQVACIQVRGKDKEYIVEKYIDGCVKSSNYCDLFCFCLNHMFIVSTVEEIACILSIWPKQNQKSNNNPQKKQS